MTWIILWHKTRNPRAAFVWCFYIRFCCKMPIEVRTFQAYSVQLVTVCPTWKIIEELVRQSALLSKLWSMGVVWILMQCTYDVQLYDGSLTLRLGITAGLTMVIRNYPAKGSAQDKTHPFYFPDRYETMYTFYLGDLGHISVQVNSWFSAPAFMTVFAWWVTSHCCSNNHCSGWAEHIINPDNTQAFMWTLGGIPCSLDHNVKSSDSSKKFFSIILTAGLLWTECKHHISDNMLAGLQFASYTSMTFNKTHNWDILTVSCLGSLSWGLDGADAVERWLHSTRTLNLWSDIVHADFILFMMTCRAHS
jgi:hypothetical protein